VNHRDWHKAYLRLHPKAALKKLEQCFVYHTGRDELYEVDERAEAFVLRCNGTSRGEQLTSDGAFVEYCLEEGLLEAREQPDPTEVSLDRGVSPSLRYLELHLSHRCNLKCRHCYLGASRENELPLAEALSVTEQFSENGGLRLLISGGEPLLYKDLRAYIAQTKELKIRRVLFTNGTLIRSENLSWLTVDEIQFSLDGWVKGHELLRGKGTFERTMKGIHAAKDAGIPISFSTMIHRKNLDEFDRMRDFITKMDAVEWGIDMPSVTGALEDHRDLTVPIEQATPFLEYAYGGGYHGSSAGYGCGRHLMAVMPDGQAVKCGFYRDKPLGNTGNMSLMACWMKMEPVPLDRLECRNCSAVDTCRGGCRFRAPHPLAPDPVMCGLYGISTYK
jgi:radical SAM protein with 4Fe4S-binding SPASM domain